MTHRPSRRHHHHVYVIELADRVWNEARFRRANPDYCLGKPAGLEWQLQPLRAGI